MPLKGKYKIKNKKKYRGNSNNIVYRSSWERKFMVFCDEHRSILEWSSEEFSVPYRSPVDGKVHRYFPDFIVKKLNREGKIETLMIEIKPKSQVKKPKGGKFGVKQRKNLRENVTWQINNAKWTSAQRFCEKYGWKFKIVTEKELNI